MLTPVLAFLGPSASGKSSVVRDLERRGVVTVTPSWTTRPRRGDEATGAVEHRFVTDAEFDRLERAGFFLEVVTMFGLRFRYGLPAVDPPRQGSVPAIMVRAPLMGLVTKHFPHHIAYQIEAGIDEARTRLLARNVDTSDIESRLRGYEEERLRGRRLAARVFVNDVSIRELASLVEQAIREDFSFASEGAGAQ